jgi:hypothetical protein
MFLLYHSKGCNICGGWFRKCYINDLHTTTCSGMLGHRILSQKRKKGKKCTPPWYVKVGGHPMESVSHGLWKEKWGGGVPSFIKDHQSANLSLKNLLSMEDSKNPITSRWQEQPPLKTNFYLSVLQMKSSSRCLITHSLCEGPFF